MEFVRCMSNYLKIVDIRMVFKFMTMFLNTRGIVRIVCEGFVGQERDTHVFMRPFVWDIFMVLFSILSLFCTPQYSGGLP